MATENIKKNPPKGDVKFAITLSEEQKRAKELILSKPYNFIIGQAGSGKTLLAVQIALDLYFKREVNKIIITRPTRINLTLRIICHYIHCYFIILLFMVKKIDLF